MLGPGRVGRALAARLRERGDSVVIGRDPALSEGCDVVVLTVPDGAVRTAADWIGQEPWLVHTAGALPVAALGANRQRALAMHPLMTFRTDGDPAQFDGAAAAVSARDADGLVIGFALAERLGLRPFELADADRVLYHCAASVGANFLCTLYAAAVRIAGHAGLPAPTARAVLLPLLERALTNAAADESGRFDLTGPVARGDAATIAAHLDALERCDPQLLPLYRALTAATVELLAPERAGDLAGVLTSC